MKVIALMILDGISRTNTPKKQRRRRRYNTPLDIGNGKQKLANQ